MGNKIAWLQLSDIHWGQPDADFDLDDVMHKLIGDVRKVHDEHKVTPDILLFGGDAAFGNSPKSPLKFEVQFDRMHKFLEELRQSISPQISRERVFIVPGNHDVDRSKVSESITYFLDAQADDSSRGLKRVLSMIRDVDDEWKRSVTRLDEYRSFLERHGYHHLLDDRQRLIWAQTVDIRGFRVGLAGFNSAWSCGRQVERGKLWLGAQWQLGFAAQKLREQRSQLNVAMVHHPEDWIVSLEKAELRTRLTTDFDFLLHGHEHLNWIEQVQGGIIRSAAAAGYENENQEIGYSITEIDTETRAARIILQRFDERYRKWAKRIVPDNAPDGTWRLKNVRFRSHDAADRPAPITKPAAKPSRPTTKRSDRPGHGTVVESPRGPCALCCDRHFKRWDVHLPAGDVVMTDIIYGLQPEGGAEPVERFALPSSAPLATSTHVDARRLDNNRLIPCAYEAMQPAGGEHGVQHMLKFDPPIVTPINIIVRRLAMGVVHTSREHQRYAGVPEMSVGAESCMHWVRIKANVLHAQVQFHVRDEHLLPTPLQLDVRDENDQRVTDATVHGASLHYIEPGGWDGFLPMFDCNPSREAIITVADARMDWQYGVRWELPKLENIEDRDAVNNLRDRLYELTRASAKVRQSATKFMRLALESFRKIAKEHAPESNWRDDAMYAALFGFDRKGGLLQCVHRAGAAGEPVLASVPLRFGSDIIGTAFASREGTVYVAGGLEDRRCLPVRLERLPDDVKVMFACPLIWPVNASGHSVGVLALTSSSDTSGLKVANGNRRLVEAYARQVYPAWQEFCRGLT